MEAMWSRFNPVYMRAMRWINDGLIGEVRMLKADFGFKAPWEPERRLLNPALAAGSILDVGIYPIALASHLFGLQPSHIQALAFLGTTGVDEQAGMILKYAHGQLAVLSSAIRTQIPNNALIIGTAGMVGCLCSGVPGWHYFGVLENYLKSPGIQRGINLKQLKWDNASEKKMESAVMPLAESLALMEIMDQIRGEINLKYPSE